MRKSKQKGVSVLAVALFVFAAFATGLAIGDGRLQLSSFDQLAGNNTLPEDLDYSSVEKVYDALRENIDGELDEDALLEGLKTGLVNAADDPYTEFFSAVDADDFQAGLDGEFSGIGAELSRDPDTNSVIVQSPLRGYPAKAAGLQPRDIIASIDGESSLDFSVTEAVQRIRGPVGTDVELGLIRGGEALSVTITRQTISIPSVTWRQEDGNIGVIEIARFGSDTSALVAQAAREFTDRSVAGVILDMRNNPGGLLDSSVDVAGEWLDGLLVVSETRGGEVLDELFADAQAPLKGTPTVVLVNGASASASEIVAGALQDHGAAKVIGTTTFGKGSVQRIVPLENGTELKVTIAKWLTPNGNSIEQAGITPDEVVEFTAEDIEANADPQLDAALQSLR